MSRRLVLVTGASGFVGTQALAPLRRRGFEVLAPSSAEADLLDPAAAAGLVRDAAPSHLLHLAWTVEPGQFWHTPENVAWLEASLRLVRAFAEGGGERVVTVGSCAEYDWSVGGTFSEEAPARPATLYGAAKHALGEVAGHYLAGVGVSHAHARLFFPFGPGEPASRLVPSVARAVLAGERAAVTTGVQVRDFLPVSETGEALAALVAADAVGAFNVGSGRGTSIAEVARCVAAAAGDPGLLGLGDLPARPEPAAIVADIGRIVREARWEPCVPLDSAIADTVDWWRRRTAAPDGHSGE